MEDSELDPAIAEAMGFSGFGNQKGKKRKFDTNDGFVDPAIAPSQIKPSGNPAKNANSLPLGKKKPADPRATESRLPSKAAPMEKRKGGGIDAQEPTVPTNPQMIVKSGERPSLGALRHGVRNENGDMVYFLPSFLEDPWKPFR